MLKIRFIGDFVFQRHSHVNEQIPEVIQGTIRFWFDNDQQNHVYLVSGDSFIIQTNRPHNALMIGKVIKTDTFSPLIQGWISSSESYLIK